VTVERTVRSLSDYKIMSANSIYKASTLKDMYATNCGCVYLQNHKEEVKSEEGEYTIDNELQHSGLLSRT
jgi:hypothetical protein